MRSPRRAQINELEHQLTHETTERRTLGENHRTLQAQHDSAEKRNVELEGEIADMREKLALLDDDKRSLQVAVDKGFDEAARLQSEVASLRSILRRGMALDEPPVAPDEPANDEAIIKAQAGKNAESA